MDNNVRVMGIDLGRQTGFGLLGGERVLSGSREVVKTWQPFGAALIALERKLQELIVLHRPDILAVARPFVRRGDTPVNLLPMYGAFAILHVVAQEFGLRLEVIEEGAARRSMLGKFTPRASAKVKQAIIRACRERGWPACDDHAGDALCIAAAVTERLCPAQAHQTTPLFIAGAAKAQPQRRRRAA